MKHAKYFMITTILLLSLLHSGCSDMMADLENSSASGSGIPSDITGLRATVSSNQVLLSWDDPVSVTFDHVEVSWDNGSGDTGSEQVIPGMGTLNTTGLTDGTEYNITLCCVYSSGARSGGARAKATPGTANGTFYYINCPNDLNNVRNNLAGYYILMTDIDLSGYANWEPIGDNTNRFTGTFDGNGHKISNLTITGSSSNHRGLFSYINGTVMDLGLDGGSVTGNTGVGSLAGYNSGTITNCYSTGTVSGNSAIGGLAGYNRSITNNSYSTGTVTGLSLVGGLVGSNPYGTITNSYSTGTVTGLSYVGGLVGTSHEGTITSCYFSGTPNNNIGTYKTTDWDDSTTFTDWDFTSIWAIDSSGTINSGYPYLRENAP